MAIILTYEAPDSLRRAVAATLAQDPRPSHVLVIDNASSQAAAETLTDPAHAEVEIVRLDENLGPGGGHAFGLQRFASSAHRYAWVMDDDCEPQAGCLAALLQQGDKGRVVFPRWVDVATGTHEYRPAWCGFLIDRSVVEAVGLPRSDFFWWAEDTEYLHWRIPVAGFDVRREPAAVVLHHGARKTDTRPPWKVYYEIRNSIYYRLRIQRHRGRRFYRLSRTLVRIGGSLLFGEQKGSRLVAYLRGFRDGIVGRLGPRWDPRTGYRG